MTAQVDHAELKRLRDDLSKFAHHAVGTLKITMDEVRNVIAACDSHAALLSEIEGLKAERDRLKLAICGGEDVPGSINAVSVDDCERFIREERSRHDWSAEQQAELDSLRTQAPDSWRPIETAPKDGTNFDSQDRTNYGKRVFTKTHWYVHPSVQGWVTDEIDCGDYEFEPTHWRPSALRPQTAESGK